MPSIVFGVFGAIVFLTVMGLGFSVLSGALTLALLNLPLMVRIAEDAIRGVPHRIARPAWRWPARSGRPSARPCCPARYRGS